MDNPNSLLRTLNFIVEHPLNKGRKAKALLSFLKWQIASRLFHGEFVYEWINDAKFFVRSGEAALTQNIYCGLIEFYDMAYTLHVLSSEDLFIDIGANVGSYTILACAVRGAKGFCFEPIPSTFQRLMNNIKLNNLLDRVQAYNIGLADKEGELYFSTKLNCTNHVVAGGESSVDTIKIKVLPLDVILAGESPSLVKIDVEGLETLVVNGMARTLENSSLHSVIIELNGSSKRYGFNDMDIIDMMVGFGFRMYAYEPFSRMLTSISTVNTISENTLFLRNEDFICHRLASAPRFKINSQEI